MILKPLKTAIVLWAVKIRGGDFNGSSTAGRLASFVSELISFVGIGETFSYEGSVWVFVEVAQARRNWNIIESIVGPVVDTTKVFRKY